jgi:hypothetical protein
MTLQEKISEAEEALHDLSLGKRVVSITRNGKSLTYTATTQVNLELYIARLKSQISTSSRRPMGIRL